MGPTFPGQRACPTITMLRYQHSKALCKGKGHEVSDHSKKAVNGIRARQPTPNVDVRSATPRGGEHLAWRLDSSAAAAP